MNYLHSFSNDLRSKFNSNITRNITWEQLNIDLSILSVFNDKRAVHRYYQRNFLDETLYSWFHTLLDKKPVEIKLDIPLPTLKKAKKQESLKYIDISNSTAKISFSVIPELKPLVDFKDYLQNIDAYDNDLLTTLQTQDINKITDAYNTLQNTEKEVFKKALRIGWLPPFTLNNTEYTLTRYHTIKTELKLFKTVITIRDELLRFLEEVLFLLEYQQDPSVQRRNIAKVLNIPTKSTVIDIETQLDDNKITIVEAYKLLKGY